MVVVAVSALCAVDVGATCRFYRGGQSRGICREKLAVLCSAPLQRVVRAHFLYFVAGFFAIGLFPACFLIRLRFMRAGRGELNWAFLFSFDLRKWPLSNVVYLAKKVSSLMRASFDRVQLFLGPYPCVRTLYGCAPCRPGQVGEELSILREVPWGWAPPYCTVGYIL